MTQPPPSTIPAHLFDAARQIGDAVELPRHLSLAGLAAASYLAGWEDRGAPQVPADAATLDEDLLCLVERYGDARADEIGAMATAGDQEIQQARDAAAGFLAQIRTRAVRSQP